MLESSISRLPAFVRRLFGVKGAAPLGIEQLIVPTLSIFEGPADHRFLRQELLFMVQNSVAAGGAGNNSFVCFRFLNATPGVVAVINRIYVGSGGSAFGVEVGASLGGVAAPNERRNTLDDRWTPQTPGIAAEAGVTVGFVLTNHASFGATTATDPNVRDFIDGPWVLTGNLALCVQQTVANQPLRVTAVGYERIAEPSEL